MIAGLCQRQEIDLSRRAAEMLGFMQQGTAQVRVEYLGRAALYDSAGRPISGQPPDVFIAEKPPTPDEARRVASAAPVDDVAAMIWMADPCRCGKANMKRAMRCRSACFPAVKMPSN